MVKIQINCDGIMNRTKTLSNALVEVMKDDPTASKNKEIFSEEEKLVQNSVYSKLHSAEIRKLDERVSREKTPSTKSNPR